MPREGHSKESNINHGAELSVAWATSVAFAFIAGGAYSVVLLHGYAGDFITGIAHGDHDAWGAMCSAVVSGLAIATFVYLLRKFAFRYGLTSLFAYLMGGLLASSAAVAVLAIAQQSLDLLLESEFYFALVLIPVVGCGSQGFHGHGARHDEGLE